MPVTCLLINEEFVREHKARVDTSSGFCLQSVYDRCEERDESARTTRVSCDEEKERDNLPRVLAKYESYSFSPKPTTRRISCP